MSPRIMPIPADTVISSPSQSDIESPQEIVRDAKEMEAEEGDDVPLAANLGMPQQVVQDAGEMEA